MKITTFKARLKHARDMRGLTQAELARQLDWQQSAVGHFEGGRRKPSFDNLRALCEALNVSGDFLLGISDVMSPPNGSVFDKLDKLSSNELEFIQTLIDTKVAGR